MADHYRVVRVRPNKVEVLIQDFPVASDAPLEEEQAQRQAALQLARQRKNQDGWHTRVYSPSPGRPDQHIDDFIWDSTINSDV